MGGLEMGSDGILRCRSGADCPNIITAKKYKEDAEKLKRVDDLFAELNIPLPYDLWLAESIQIRERLKKRIEELPKQLRWSEKHRDYQTWLELQKILEGDTFSLEEGRAVAEAQWTGEEK